MGHAYDSAPGSTVAAVQSAPRGRSVSRLVAAQALAGVGPGSVYFLGVLTALATLLGVFWAGGTRRPGAVTGLWAVAFWTVAAGDLALQANQPSTEVFSTPA